MRDATLAVFAAVLGAIVGSFLNACIHRLPRGISLSNPKRSFCPSCKKMIPWYENLPVISWLVLKGKCSSCKSPISPRYVFVEVVTAGAFLSAWLVYGLPLAFVYWIFLSLMIVATFIDIEHFIIPDEITWGGTILGILLAGIFPEMMGSADRWIAMLQSLVGAALGFGLLWLVVEGGKLVFGKKKHKFAEGSSFTWVRDGDRADLQIGDESLRWEDIFGRESDVMTLECSALEIDGESVAPGTAKFNYDRIRHAGGEVMLDNVATIKGTLTTIVIPREAMGFGDVKFIAAIGAFLGWEAVLFTIFASSIIGSLAGLAGILLAKDRAGSRLPFGPFLAIGAVWWIFGGRELFSMYLSIFERNPYP